MRFAYTCRATTGFAASKHALAAWYWWYELDQRSNRLASFEYKSVPQWPFLTHNQESIKRGQNHTARLSKYFQKSDKANVSMKTPDTKAKLLNNISLSKHLSSKKVSGTSSCGNQLEFSVLTLLTNVPWLHTPQLCTHCNCKNNSLKMVHQNRTPSKAIPAKHLSPMRNTDMVSGKYAVSSSPVDSFLRNNRLTVNSSGSGSSYNSAAYKYNNMVANNREQFNALHFC